MIFPSSPAVLVAALLFTLSCDRMISSFKNHACYGAVFQGHFFMGLSVLMLPSALPLVVVVLLSLLLYQRSLRELLCGVCGLLLPAALGSWFCWMRGEELSYLVNSFVDNLMQPTESLVHMILSGGLWGRTFMLASLLALLLMASIVYMFLEFRGMRRRAKRIHIHFAVLLLVTVLSHFIPSSGVGLLPFIAVEAAILVHLLFAKGHAVIAGVGYLLMLILSAV